MSQAVLPDDEVDVASLHGSRFRSVDHSEDLDFAYILELDEVCKEIWRCWLVKSDATYVSNSFCILAMYSLYASFMVLWFII